MLDIRKTKHEQIEEKINKAIIDFRLEGLVEQKIYKLSLYQKYIVSVARLSFRKLDVVLIDNIFEELSKDEVKELLKIFKKYFINKNALVIYATSDEEIAKKLSTRIIELDYGVVKRDEKNKG